VVLDSEGEMENQKRAELRNWPKQSLVICPKGVGGEKGGRSLKIAMRTVRKGISPGSNLF